MIHALEHLRSSRLNLNGVVRSCQRTKLGNYNLHGIPTRNTVMGYEKERHKDSHWNLYTTFRGNINIASRHLYVEKQCIIQNPIQQCPRRQLTFRHLLLRLNQSQSFVNPKDEMRKSSAQFDDPTSLEHAENIAVRNSAEEHARSDIYIRLHNVA